MSRRSTEWNHAKQHRILAQLKGFWAADVWDMQSCPVQGSIAKGKTPVQNDASHRRLISQEHVIATLRPRVKQLEPATTS